MNILAVLVVISAMVLGLDGMAGAGSEPEQDRQPCGEPGQVSEQSGEYCTYLLTVTRVNLDSWTVEGQIPDAVYKEGGASVPMRKHTYVFRVRDLDKLSGQFILGQPYHFTGQQGSPYLELLP